MISIMQCRCQDSLYALRKFLRNQDITFVGVDIRNDHRLLYKEWLYIPPGKHLDLQDMLKLPDAGERAGMAKMAATLIHPKYASMKEEFLDDYEALQGHHYWEWKPLADMNMKYAAIDGYVTYELTRIVTIVNQGQNLQWAWIQGNKRRRRAQ